MYHISEDTKKAAVRCKKGHVCLTRQNGDLCKIICCVDDVDLYVTCKDDSDCGYKMSYNGRTLCMCPVRGEVYSRYDV